MFPVDSFTRKRKQFFDETCWYVDDKPCILKQKLNNPKRNDPPCFIGRVKRSYVNHAGHLKNGLIPKNIPVVSHLLLKKVLFRKHSEVAVSGCSTKQVFLKFFAKFTGKPLCWILWSFKSPNLFKRCFQQRCFPVNFAKFLKTRFL